jgi:beta-galactosidase
VVKTTVIKTAGKPQRILLAADRKIIQGQDLAFITARVVDKDGQVVPLADHAIRFSVAGNGRLVGADNGFQADTVSLKSSTRHCWRGLALAIVQAGVKKGNITLKADSAGLLPAVLYLKTND